MPESRRRWLHLIAAFSAASFAFGRVLDSPRLPLRPQLTHYREAERLALQRKGQIWFPMHPVVTLYTERSYYHDEDGWWVRRMTHKSILPEHASAHLPPKLNTIALQNNWSYAGVANGMLAPNAHAINFGHWIVWVPGREPTSR